MKIKPLHDRVIIKPDTAKSVTEGGIIIPDTAKEKPMRGKVLAAGTLCKEVKAKDSVLYTKHVGIAIEDNLIMRESDILAIV